VRLADRDEKGNRTRTKSWDENENGIKSKKETGKWWNSQERERREKIDDTHVDRAM